jgi:hypothetical protein
MPTATRDVHLPALDDRRRRETGNELQPTLVELVDLSLIGKQLHWNIHGRPFKPLHEHLDELVDSWRELSDAGRVARSPTQLSPKQGRRGLTAATTSAQAQGRFVRRPAPFKMGLCCPQNGALLPATRP